MNLNETVDSHPTINIDSVTDMEVDGVDMKDYPDFSDAYMSSAVWKDSGELLNDDELDRLSDEHPDVVHDLAHENYR